MVKQLHGFVGSGAFCLNLYVDADFAGCLDTARSTSGMFLTLAGDGWSFPLEWGFKRQSCVAHSTPEAEFVALAKGLRGAALPLSILLENVTKHPVMIKAFEDNTSTIQIVTKGRSPALRHLSKTHCVSLAWVAEVCNGPDVEILHIATDLELADSFTKSLDRTKREHALTQLKVF